MLLHVEVYHSFFEHVNSFITTFLRNLKKLANMRIKNPKTLDIQRFSDFFSNAGDRGRIVLRPSEARKEGGLWASHPHVTHR